MNMSVETFAYDVLEGLNDGEACFIISPSLKHEQLKAVKEISNIPFRVIEMGKNAKDGYMLDPSKCGVYTKSGKLVHKGFYPECCRYVDKSPKELEYKVQLLDTEHTHYCFVEYPNEDTL